MSEFRDEFGNVWTSISKAECHLSIGKSEAYRYGIFNFGFYKTLRNK